MVEAPVRWAGDKFAHPANSADRSGRSTNLLRVALVNNMPDPALEDTESQFFDLLDAAAGELPIHVQLFSLPKIVRGERAAHNTSTISTLAPLPC